MTSILKFFFEELIFLISLLSKSHIIISYSGTGSNFKIVKASNRLDDFLGVLHRGKFDVLTKNGDQDNLDLVKIKKVDCRVRI